MLLALLAFLACSVDTTPAPPPAPIEESSTDPMAAPLDVAAPPADAQKTASGLAWKVLHPGEGGAHPLPEATVTVNYTGWTTDGKMFDSSLKRGKPASFPLQNVIPGWTEGLQLLTAGESARFWIPEALAYKGRPGKPAGMLVFDVDLISFQNPPQAPADVAAAPADATLTPSGLAWKVLYAAGRPERPSKNAIVTAHYAGWTTDGKLFDTSLTRSEPTSFSLAEVIPGRTEGLQLMGPGDKVRFWIPEALAYQGKPGNPAGMLVFEVELISFVEPPAVPADVAAPPKDAKKTASGLAWKVLKPGTSDAHPAATSRVKVHYSGWTTDGKMFDSSVTRSEPASFPLNRVIPGWTEGLQLMTPGMSARLWIPSELAYDGKPGRPQGMLVFDVELLEIQDTGTPAAPQH